jgi:hypothetical protein
MPFFGWLSDHWDRWTLYIAGEVLSAALAFPLFALIVIWGALVIAPTVIAAMCIGPATMFGPQA